ncbi:MAG TPA: tetratricopeptide repeat protein [Cyclobacteriaceae bacterium]|nr:tetratricopeptide repeat protein [Cyclobacteriaceae bacterium]
MTDQIIQRATLLIEHKRFEEAERELRILLASDPNHPYALALLGLSKTELGKHDEAVGYLKQALGQQPDNSYFLYLLGLVQLRKDNIKEAEKYLLSAISYDPHNANYFGTVALIKLQETQWEDALTYANRGLQVDPENLVCLNARSTALLKLDRKEESYETIKEALHNDPHNSYTHANLGWGLLERGDYQKALESFREALKLDPENEHAKAGLVEALKARYWFYRVFLKYSFWMSNMSSKYQWFFILGLWFGVRLLNGLSKSNPGLEPFVTPIIYLYMAFALSTWILEPISNLFLRLNVYGRYALNEEQMKASTFTGIGFAITILGLIGLLFTSTGTFVYMAFYGVGVMVLCSAMFKPSVKSKRMIAMALAIGLCLVGFLFLLIEFGGGNAGLLLSIFLIGTVAYQFVINALISR